MWIPCLTCLANHVMLNITPPLFTDAIQVAIFMGIFEGEITHWNDMIVLYHHDCILIVDEDNVPVKNN